MTAGANIADDLRAAGLAGEGDVVLVPLSGGVSCDVWKVETPDGPIVVKRPLAQLRVDAEWHAPIERVAWVRHTFFYEGVEILLAITDCTAQPAELRPLPL